MSSACGSLTIGTFDGLHSGHLRLLDVGNKLHGGVGVVVGVNSTRFVTKYKGRPPVRSEDERMAVVKAITGVHRVVLNDGPGADLIRELRPRYLVIGGDWMPPVDYYGQIGMAESELDELGITLVYVARFERSPSSSAHRTPTTGPFDPTRDPFWDPTHGA